MVEGSFSLVDAEPECRLLAIEEQLNYLVLDIHAATIWPIVSSSEMLMSQPG